MIGFFRTILYTPLYNILIFLAWIVPGHSIGWAIIILTILIRFALLPASLKASRAQVRLQALQPKINKLKKEIKDQQAQGRALMQLYKDEGASPFGTCLPILIQLPIIFVLYQVFLVGFDTSNYSLLYYFTPRPEVLDPYFYGLNLAKPELWALPIFAGLTQFILSKMMMPPAQKKEAGAEMDPMQMANKQMVYLFPLMTIFIARSLPAALALYWIITTVFGIAQQFYVNNQVKKNKPVEDGDLDVERYKNIEAKKLETPVPVKNTKTGYIQKAMNKRLDKQEKKTGVEVTIRTKK